MRLSSARVRLSKSSPFSARVRSRWTQSILEAAAAVVAARLRSGDLPDRTPRSDRPGGASARLGTRASPYSRRADARLAIDCFAGLGLLALPLGRWQPSEGEQHETFRNPEAWRRL